MDSPAVVVPFRLGGLTRLADALMPDERERLALAMLRDVVTAIRGAGLEPTLAVADILTGTAVQRVLPDVDAVLDDGASDLDASIAAHANRHPDGLLVVMADLPTLQPGEVIAVLEEDAAVVVAETEDGGTGALLRRPATVMGTAYGPGSGARHRGLAEAAGVMHIRVRVPGFLFEIDRPDDLSRARHLPVGLATSNVLKAL